MSDWIKREKISTGARPITVVENNGTRTTLYTKTRTFYEFNTKTGEIRPPSSPTLPNTSTPYTRAIIYTEIPKDAEGDKIFEQAIRRNPINVIDDTITGKRYVAQADVISNQTGEVVTIVESGPWVGQAIKNNIGNWKFGKPADWTNTSLSIANSTAINAAFDEAKIRQIDGINSPQNIGGNLGLSRSANPARPTPEITGDDDGGDTRPPEEQNTTPSPVISGASPNIGTPEDFTEFFPTEKNGDTLRYPSSIIEDSTDYLLISITKYAKIGDKLIRGSNRQSTDSRTKSKEGKKTGIGYVILPIPSNIQDGNSVSYADGTLDGITAAAVRGAYDIMTTDAEGKTTEELLTSFKDKLGNAYNNITDAGLKGQILRSLAVQAASLIPGTGSITPDQLLARQTGGILNPNMELLFNGVTLRSFKFSFKMTPRNKDEAASIRNIIKTLKVNMAPQTLTSDSFLRTPNVFDLQYMKGNGPHPFLHRFKTCALTDMSVNYTGEGLYASYSDATPVSMVMDLTFKELEPIYNTDYDNVGGVGY